MVPPVKDARLDQKFMHGLYDKNVEAMTVACIGVLVKNSFMVYDRDSMSWRDT